mgnify:CR=1 FL=1
MAPMTNVTPFSVALRERSSGAHSSSEGQDFMSGLLEGDGTRDDYISLVAQHYFIYEALEAAAAKMVARSSGLTNPVKRHPPMAVTNTPET